MSARRDALLARYAAVRAATEALAAPLSPEDQLLQSMPDCSPTKWHRAHTTWFFEEFILTPRGIAPVDPRYRYLFNSYYDAVGPRHPRPQRGLLSRPSCDEVAAYRRAVDARVIEVLGGLSDEDLDAALPLMELGLAHEEQHQELVLTDIVHALSLHPLRPAARPAKDRPSLDAPAAAPLRWIEYNGGVSPMGATGDGFTFDNERPRHRVFLEPYALASRPITVRELRAFIEEGGYGAPALWLSEGWAWARSTGREAPLHLRIEGGRAVAFGVDGEREALDDEPASHLTYYEADAVARFLGARLPTEAEWEHAAQNMDPDVGNDRARGALRPLPSRHLGDAPGQLFGDVWEWTSSAYAPYPGYSPAAGAVGEYNGKFMVNQMVLRGGSCLTPRGHTRATYRNFWHPHTAFQMTGARLARSLTVIA